ncbi:MAG TPA: secondary thiamine-phosphate synthase enzyme YjbQ [Bacteroidota bacterium]|nr:secondary thiamine-phosphate synthase enzyme YjbQ [Bacteroidota bacterium]
MPVRQTTFSVSSKGFTDVIDITGEVRGAVAAAGVKDGIVTVFVPGSTAGITTIEFESGAIEDLKDAIDRIAPRDIHYAHNARWGDGNGFSHVRSALLGPSVTVPFNDRQLRLGSWQQIVLVDFDNRPRKRDIIVQVLGE